MKAGDWNTRFFHAITKNRRAQNFIHSLFDDAGKEWFEEKDLGRLAEQYFGVLFGSEDVGMVIEDWEDIPAGISAEQNADLLEEITQEEVRRALFDINPNKCLGPDGMSGFFYQQFWDAVGPELTQMVQNFFQNGVMEDDMNLTNICLIPKKLKPTSLPEFRPISLCNVVFKVISKILAKRLKITLPSMISDSQAAFVEGRLISDNILVAHEMLHALNSRNKCAEEYIALKTEISKAYDRVEWPFLHRAMKVLGYSERWCNVIMWCVQTVKYQVLINGTPHGIITPTR